MKKIFACLLLFVSISSAEPTDKDLSGIYEVHGIEQVNDAPSPYTGTAFIEKRVEGYAIRWVTTDLATNNGIAYVENGQLICAWTTGPRIGLTKYKIGKELEGKWMASNLMKWFDETLIYKSPLPKVRKSL